MDTISHTPATNPPRLISSLVSGFNLVAGRIYLIILPVALDLLLWFGPHFRVKNLAQPALKAWIDMVGASEYASMTGAFTRIWTNVLERFNLMSMLSTLPVGVPSLFSGVSPVKNPVGSAPMIELASWGQVLSGWLLFSLLGLVLGAIYFNAVSRSTANPAEPFSLPRTIWETGQTIALTLVLIFILFLISIPAVILITVMALISLGLAQFGLLVVSFALLWILIPLIFSPHGIFAARQNVVRSMLISTRMVRLLFPGVGLFLLAALILAQGMGYLWRIPPETSWLSLAAILGNAFVSTSLLAASFVYYRGAINWVEQLRRGAVAGGIRI
jgi:hypothetical protein